MLPGMLTETLPSTQPEDRFLHCGYIFFSTPGLCAWHMLLVTPLPPIVCIWDERDSQVISNDLFFSLTALFHWKHHTLNLSRQKSESSFDHQAVLRLDRIWLPTQGFGKIFLIAPILGNVAAISWAHGLFLHFDKIIIDRDQDQLRGNLCAVLHPN